MVIIHNRRTKLQHLRLYKRIKHYGIAFISTFFSFTIIKMTCPSRKRTRDTYFRRQDHYRRQQQHQQLELDEALARMLNAVHIAPPPDHYLMRCLQRAEEREKFAREQELRWRTMLYEHLDGSNNHKIYWTGWRFGLLLFLILGFIIILVKLKDVL